MKIGFRFFDSAVLLAVQVTDFYVLALRKVLLKLMAWPVDPM